MKRLSILLCLIVLGAFFMSHATFAQTSFSIPPKSYPVNVPFKCDAGVDRYWHVTSVTCTGRANGGYKFQIKGVAQKTSRSLPIDLFYPMPGNRIKQRVLIIFHVSRRENIQFRSGIGILRVRSF